jgi:acyl-homoserine-lactone acylase
MKAHTYLSILILLSQLSCAQPSANEEISRWEKTAKNITIIRDNYGVPHIYGKSDADCVFGMIYAQCEDDFNRVERNYITMLGRTSEVTGESDLYEDLLIRMTIDSTSAIQDYQNSPDWLKKLLQSHADGINYYLYKHPNVKPALLNKFQPWYALMYTDGSISAIQTGGLDANDIKAFYASKDVSANFNQNTRPKIRQIKEEQLSGSNGFAIAPSKSTSGKAMLYINPHVTFYFRPELHMVSEEGLDVYGAVTWGQFFVYQGFNEHLGFMHTSSDADAADLYAEKIIKQNGKYFYEYDGKLRPVQEKNETISFRKGDSIFTKTFIVFSTHHGPVMGLQNDKWLSLKTKNRSLNGLIQSWQRNKVKNLAEFKANMEQRANLSNNTIYADDKGNIAYWHGNYMPIRDTSYDWNAPVDGSISATEWKGMHAVNDIVHSINPLSGWLQNCNGTPYSVAGKNSPSRKNYPGYMAPDGENFRQQNAIRLLSVNEKFTMDKLITTGYDKHLTAFDSILPILFTAYDKSKTTNPAIYESLSEPISVLKAWDRNMSESSVAENLAIHWGELMMTKINAADPEYLVDITLKMGKTLRAATSIELLQPLQDIISDMDKNLGSWKISWGEINRFQRISADLYQAFDDAKPSLPMGMASSLWGALPSYNSVYFQNTNKRYGYGGNSFICAVEFGEKIKARSLLAGGESADPSSPHFFDQGEMYTKGKFKEVLFYKEDVFKHAEKTYHPGE